VVENPSLRRFLSTETYVAFLVHQLASEARSSEPILREIQSVLQPMTGVQLQLLVAALPDAVGAALYRLDPDLLGRLPLTTRVEYLGRWILAESDPKVRGSLLDELLDCMQPPGGASLWLHIPDALIISDELWPTAPSLRRMVALVNLLRTASKDEG